MKPIKNIFACLVHEKQECIVDLVRNLHYLDPSSLILLYNGGTDKQLFEGFPFERYGAVIIPGSRPLKWGWLHDFALDCMKYALKNLSFDILTIVDSDQLGIGENYSRYMAKYLDNNNNTGMFGITGERQRGDTKVDPAVSAYQEEELWRPFLEKFPDGVNKFLYWTFWPATVFTRAAAKDLVNLFDMDNQLKEILQKTRIWASEEIILPTLVSLLGYKIEKNPCAYDYVKYGANYSLADIKPALEQADTFWIHPVPRDAGNELRKYIAAHYDDYKKKPPRLEGGAGELHITGSPADNHRYISNLSINREIEKVEGWLDDEEAELLIYAAHDVLRKQTGDTAVVEIGSYCGKATIALGSLINEMGNTGAALYAVDLFDGEVGAADTLIEKKPPTFGKFMANINLAGLSDIVRPVVSKSYRLMDWDIPVCFLLIDGLHDYTNVARDFYHFEKWIVPCGYIAFHDYADYFPGVKTFVDELLLSGNYKKIACAKSMIILEKVPREKECRKDNESTVEKTGNGLVPAGISHFPREGHKKKQLIALCMVLLLLLGISTFMLIDYYDGYRNLKKVHHSEQRSRNNEKKLYERTLGMHEEMKFKVHAFAKRYPLFDTIVSTAFEEAGKNKLSPYTVMSVIQVESDFDPYARSSVAHGLMQINLQAWKDYFSIDENRIYEIGYNISLGCKILRHYLDKSAGNLSRALFLYNNGYRFDNKKFVPKVLGSIFQKAQGISDLFMASEALRAIDTENAN